MLRAAPDPFYDLPFVTEMERWARTTGMLPTGGGAAMTPEQWSKQLAVWNATLPETAGAGATLKDFLKKNQTAIIAGALVIVVLVATTGGRRR